MRPGPTPQAAAIDLTNMRIHNPIYLAFALATAAYVGLANHNGWSLIQTVASRTWQHSIPNTQHK